MGERKAWTKEEDLTLINIIEHQKIKKWSAVAKALELDFKIFGRTGKQCRERWHNQLDPNIKKSQWTIQEGKILFQFHNKYGNKWARISQQLEGRTDNCVKNHFYSTLRRAFRTLNKFTIENKQKQGLKQLKSVMLSKLVAAAEDKFDKKLQLSDQLVQKAVQLKNRLIPFSKQQQNSKEDQQEMESIILQILTFCKSYKRKKAKKAKKDDEYDFEDVCEGEQEMQCEQQKQQINQSSTQQKQQINNHTNLFTFSPQNTNKQQSNLKQLNKQTSQLFQLQMKSKSKVWEEQYLPEYLLKRSSNVSNMSGMFKLPSYNENLSFSNQFGFDSSLNFNNLKGSHRNIFGVDIQNL